jgi:hypothetical protein
LKYTSTPLYRAVTFTAAAGDPVDVWLRSSQGDPVTWILDAAYKVVAKNDDASSATTDSHLAVTLRKAGTFYVVFRDYSYESHYFTVELKGPAACNVALGDGGSNATSDELEQTFEDGGAGWELATRKLPACTNFADTAALRALVVGGHFLDADPVAVGAAATGGGRFVQLVDRALGSLHDRAGADSHADSLAAALKQPIMASPGSFLEIPMSTDAEECSQVGDVLIDLRSGVVYLITQLLPC